MTYANGRGYKPSSTVFAQYRRGSVCPRCKAMVGLEPICGMVEACRPSLRRGAIPKQTSSVVERDIG